MKKLFLTTATLVFAICLAYSQTASNYFEVFTKPAYSQSGNGHFVLNKDSILAKIQNIPDTVSNRATFVVGAPNASDIDSVFLTLTNSLGSIVYTTALPYSAISAASGFRISNDVIYYTVGPYQYLKRFTATARLKYSTGGSSTVRTFTKN